MEILPAYRIEPPDVLSIDIVNLVPRSPYHLQPGDLIQIDIRGEPPNLPLSGQFAVQSGET